MSRDEFQIGREFKCGEKRWRCTDIGTRVITAICIADHREGWQSGPPYPVPEEVFDEDDLPGCEEITEEERADRTEVVM